jgi:hypothetical protein
VTNHDPYLPDSSELLPLPAGLTVIDNRDLGCGSGSCTREILVGSHDARPESEIRSRVQDHLSRNHGWQLDQNDSGCRRNGWLVDRTTLCVSLFVDDQQRVVIDLEGDEPASDPVIAMTQPNPPFTTKSATEPRNVYSVRRAVGRRLRHRDRCWPTERLMKSRGTVRDDR